MHYTRPLYRPPSEAQSLILQVTNGCSWNNCTFCEMYTAPQKKFRPKAQADLELELDEIAASGYPVQRVFLADGDAMTLSTRRLEDILRAVREKLPSVRRITSYCLPRNVKKKSSEELQRLREAGLSMVYVGCESGDSEVLELVQKGETYDSSLEALSKLKTAGIKLSIMILNGLGGRGFSEQHAINSARLMNAAQPQYLSTLVVSFPQGRERFEANFEAHGGFRELTSHELFQEMRLLLSELDLKRTVYRSNHVSNHLSLSGELGRDKERLLATLDMALANPDAADLPPRWMQTGQL